MSQKPFSNLIRTARKRLSSENSQTFRKPFLRDLIYFDFDKTASIASQLEGGLIKEIQATYSQSREIGGGIGVSLANIGGNANDSRTKLETRGIHHDLLVRVERALESDAKVAVDLNQKYQKFGDSVKTDEDKAVEELHKILSQKPYVRVEGVCRFHDYQRMKTHIDGISKIGKFMGNSARDRIEKSEAYRKLQKQIEEGEEQLKSITDRNQRKTKQRRVDNLKEQLDTEVDKILDQSREQIIPDWQAEGIKDIIDILMPNKNNLLIQPFDKPEQFKVISNLKRDCFVDSDSDNVLFHYGSQPNVKLTVFGLVTSIPKISNSEIPSDNSSNQSTGDSIKQFEQSFNKVFDLTTQIEKFGLFAYYPRVIVYPLAVYYTIRK